MTRPSMMDSDISELPHYRGHAPVPLKKRYNWSQLFATAPPRKPHISTVHGSNTVPHRSNQQLPAGGTQSSKDRLPPDFETLDSGQLSSLQLLNDQRSGQQSLQLKQPQSDDLLQARSHDQDVSETLEQSHQSGSPQFPHDSQHLRTGQRTHPRECIPRSASRNQDRGHVSHTKGSGHSSGKGRLGKHGHHRDKEEQRKHAREWILQNDHSLRQKPLKKGSRDEIYIQIAGRQYLAIPVDEAPTETPPGVSIKKEEWYGSENFQQNRPHSTSSSYAAACRPSFPGGSPPVRDTTVDGCVSHPLVYNSDSLHLQLDMPEEPDESLEQFILKDKLRMLRQMREMATANYATVPLESRDLTLEVRQQERDSANAQNRLLDQLDGLGRPGNLEAQCSPPLPSYTPRQATVLPSVRSFLPRQMDSPHRYPSPQLSRPIPSPSPSLQSPSPAPSNLLLPLSPGSVTSSSERMAENFASTTSTRFGSSPDSTSIVQETPGVASPTSSELSSGGGVNRGDEFSPGPEPPDPKDFETVQTDIPEIKVEPDVGCSESPKVKRPEDNKCPVCGDEVSGYHYGIYSCESCKGFFKRTVQSKRNERLRCARDGNCEMNLRSRKHCASCRFQKCVSQGMKLEAIRGDRQRGGRSMYEGSSEHRRRLMIQIQQQKGEAPCSTTKQKRRHKVPAAEPKETWETQVAIKEEPSPEPQPSCSEEDQHSHVPQLINELLGHSAFLLAQPLAPCCQMNGLTEECIFRGICHMVNHHLNFMFEWAQGLPYFRELEKDDQQFIYRHRWIPLMLTHYCFSIPRDPAFVQLRDGRVIDLEQCFESANFLNFVRSLKDIVGFFVDLKLDAVECAVLRLLVLLNSDAPINQPSRLNHFQEKVQDTLIQYVISKDPRNVRRVGDILLRFTEIEKLCHLLHEQFTFRCLGGQLSEFNQLCEMLKTE